MARMGERRGAYRGFVGRPEGKRPLVRPGRRWQLYIKVYLFEKWDGGSWDVLIWPRKWTDHVLL